MKYPNLKEKGSSSLYDCVNRAILPFACPDPCA